MVIIQLMNSQSASPLVSIVVPNYNGAPFLEKCLRSLLRQTYPRIEIIVVDNASRDESPAMVGRVAPQAVLLRQSANLGFAGGFNAGMRQAKGEWIGVLNNDAEAADNWLSECMAAADRHRGAAFLATKIYESRGRGRIYSAGDCFLRAGIGYRRGQQGPDREDYCAEAEIFSACGCAALYRRPALEAAGGYDERFFAYFEDIDLALRLRAAGQRGFFVPAAEVYHHGGATSGGEFSSLAVRLRTRNALLLLLKSLPASILLRCLPMILAAQASWLVRVLARGKLWSYLRGLAGVAPLVPAMLGERRRLRKYRQESPGGLWQAILISEALAGRDYTPKPAAAASRFLAGYFRIFGPRTGGKAGP